MHAGVTLAHEVGVPPASHEPPQLRSMQTGDHNLVFRPIKRLPGAIRDDEIYVIYEVRRQPQMQLR
jgi:hypothetical protein